jgi:outer membrane immunogenic protein
MRQLRALVIAALATAACATGAAAQSQGFAPDPIYNSPLFNFEGFYAGAQGGAAWLPGPGIVGTVAGVAGVNFALNDAMLAGLEFQGGASINGTGVTGIDVLLLGHVGTYLTNDLMAYGAAGGGLVNGVGSYAFGGGLEYPLADQISVRGEILGTGAWGVMPNGARASAGVLFHMN